MRKRSGIVGKILGIVLPIIMFLGLAVLFAGSVVRCSYYNEVMKDPLYVDAEVTLHQQDEDSEGDTIYVAYVSYTAGDTYYKNVRYNSRSSASKLAPVGSHMRLAVDPNDPGTLLNKVSADATACWSGAFLCVFLAVFLKQLRSAKLSQGNRWVTETDIMEKDLHIAIRAKFFRVLTLLLAVMFITLPLVFPNLLGIGCQITAAVCAGLWLICMLNTIIATWKVNHGLYEIHTAKMTKKDESYDTDSGTTYTLYYAAAGRSWSKNVTRQKYLAAEVGATVYAVYLKGGRTPILHYDQQGDATSYI